jgi:NAD(P)-dependent dehydrogenase (short-subunit alcohol dehydrogenase family)
VLVTGGSTGIGLAVARRLADGGARLTLIARDHGNLQEAVRELPGDGHRAHPLDVTDQAGWSAFAAALGELDGLVCAAAVLGPIGPPGSYAPEAFARTIEVNLMGTLLAIHHCLPVLRASRGAIVLFSGGGATAPLPRYDAYAASKAAVVRLAENMADDLLQAGVRINCVAPGFVATRMHEDTLAAGAEMVGADYYRRTRAQLESGGVPAAEAAELTCLLLEDETQIPFAGKLISAQWDPWRDAEYRRALARRSDLATLRRIDDTMFAPLPAEAPA